MAKQRGDELGFPLIRSEQKEVFTSHLMAIFSALADEEFHFINSFLK